MTCGSHSAGYAGTQWTVYTPFVGIGPLASWQVRLGRGQRHPEWYGARGSEVRIGQSGTLGEKCSSESILSKPELTLLDR
jgi:hypothetical protein